MGFSGDCSCGAVPFTVGGADSRFQCPVPGIARSIGDGPSTVLVFRRATSGAGGVREMASPRPRCNETEGFCPNCGVSVYNKPDKSSRIHGIYVEASTVQCLSSPPSSSTPRAAILGFLDPDIPELPAWYPTRDGDGAIRRNVR